MKSPIGTALCATLLPALRSYCSARWKLVALMAAAAAWMPGPAPYPGPLEAAVRRALEVERGLQSEGAGGMHWIDGRARRRTCWSGGSRVALLARRSEYEPRDVYLARIESTPEGALLRLCDVYNLTNTALADEAQLAGDGARLAWLLEAQQRSYRLETATVDAADPAELAAWSELERWQWRLTEWQESGQMSAIARRSFRIEPALSELRLEWIEAGVSVSSQGKTQLIAHPPLSDPPYDDPIAPLREEARPLARPGSLLTWAVDRARASPRIGSERLQWLKATVFDLDARLERVLAAAPTAFAEAADLQDAVIAPGDTLQAWPLPAADASASERWPPARLTPLWSPALEGEGEWRSLAGDVFVRDHPGLAPPFTTTFIRPDPRLETARVVAVAWDPRRVDLHFMAGTEEPQSATGEIGSGLIPRTPRVLPRLLGAFNGGFQSVHGRFGTQVDGRLLSAPRAYAATVARFSDGAVGFGTWPLGASVPSDIDSFRQNLTPLVGGGVFNPYGRTWWGGAPIGWKDVARTVRSALCETRDGLLTYFYGSRVDHEALGAALLMARCRYGLHLDMNAGHTGFEFYSIVPSTEPALPAEALDARWKVEAPVPDLPGWRFRSRRLFRNMQLMHFPRYIERQARDFFYLTERTLLPAQVSAAPDGPRPLTPIAADAGRFPQLAAVASVRPDPARPDTEVRLLALDLKWLSPSLGAAGPVPSGTVVSVSLPEGGETARALWVGKHRARVGGGAADAGHLLAKESETGSSAAWGLIDEEILIYAEVVTARDAARDPALLDTVLQQAGAGERLPASAPNFIAIKGETDLRGQRVDLAARGARGEAALHFQPDAWQALRPLFADTPIVDPETWQPHQVEPSR